MEHMVSSHQMRRDPRVRGRILAISARRDALSLLRPAGPAGVRPICLVRLIESHAPLLRFAFPIFSLFSYYLRKIFFSPPGEGLGRSVFRSSFIF